MSNVELRNLRKAFGAHEVVHGVSMHIEDGCFAVFVGPSGCGKSTMLRMIAGLEAITGGDLLIDGVRVNDEGPTARGIAMVFQSYALYPNMTVYQNMAFGLEQQRMPRDRIRGLVMDAARLLKIEPLLDRRPGALSGGQSQRVAIGRAIVRNPRIFLFDEPLSNLDAELRVHMRLEIANLHKRMGRTTIYVTHDQVEAMTLADRIVVFNEGRIEQAGSPLDLYNSPTNRFVAGFLGSPKMNFIEGLVVADGSGGAAADIPGGQVRLRPSVLAAPGTGIVVGIRPEHLVLGSPEASNAVARVRVTEQLGGETFLHCDLHSPNASHPVPLVVRCPGQRRFVDDELVGLTMGPQDIHCFDPATGAVR